MRQIKNRKIHKINENNKTAVEVFENGVWSEQCKRNDEDYLFSDLTGLYMDIIHEIKRTNGVESVIIYEYAKLLEQDLQLYSGKEAYTAGLEAKDKPLKDVLNAYVCGIVEQSREQRLDSRIQECFEKISALLGDKRGLVTDFTEIYRKVHGVVQCNIDEFISFGQTSGDDTATA